MAALALDLDQLQSEIRALYKAELPPAIINQITRGAHEQVAIGRMMLDDCMIRAAGEKLTPKHLANAKKWITGVRVWIEKRQALHATVSRRKLCLVKARN